MTETPTPGAYQVPLEVYDELERATPEQRAEIVLRLIEQHPEGRLELPAREGMRQDILRRTERGRDSQRVRRATWAEKPFWWDKQPRRANLRGVDVQRVNLRNANLRRAQLQDAILDDVDLQDANLENADLRGALLRHADLQRADFAGAVLQEAHLDGSDLREASMWDADLQRAGLWDTDLRGVKLAGAQLQRANLMDADLRGARLESAHLQDAHLEKAQLQGASLWGAELQGTHLADAQLQALDLSLCDLGHAFFCDARLDRTRLRWEQLGGAIGEELAARDKRRTTEERMRLFGEATRGYLVLKRNFDDLGDYDAASKAYRKERRMEKCEAWQRAKVALAKRDWFGAIRSGFKAFGDHLVECVCDYGESWRRVVAWMIFMLLILGPALSMALGNLYWMGENYHIYYDYTSPVSRALYSYGQHVLYALDAFTTASFAELKPGTDCVRLVSGLIAMAGIILAGLLGFVAGNRIRRS